MQENVFSASSQDFFSRESLHRQGIVQESSSFLLDPDTFRKPRDQSYPRQSDLGKKVQQVPLHQLQDRPSFAINK